MADMTGYQRVSDPADPKRCQGITKNAQCMLVCLEGSNYCPIHGGTADQKRIKKAQVRNLMAERYRRRISAYADKNGIKSLRDEIGVLRMMLDASLEQCQTDTDLILKSGPLADLVMKIEKLVSSCQHMDEKLGIMMDRQEATQLISGVIDIIGKRIDEEILELVIDDINELIEAGGPDSI